MMDLVMPGMTGIEATQRLRDSQWTNPPTIIGISASVFEEDAKRFLDAGVDTFLAKPFRQQHLLELLARHAGLLFCGEAAPDRTPSPAPAKTRPQ